LRCGGKKERVLLQTRSQKKRERNPVYSEGEKKEIQWRLNWMGRGKTAKAFTEPTRKKRLISQQKPTGKSVPNLVLSDNRKGKKRFCLGEKEVEDGGEKK